MPWGRLDDSLYDHPKLDRLPVDRRLEAVGLWARSISWCNRFLTDGHVPRGRIEKLDGSLELADLLVAAGLFEETADGYAIHDFLQFNDSRTDVLERRADDKKRQRDWREKKKAERNGNSGHDVSHSVTASVKAQPVTPGVTGGVTPSVTGTPARATRSANPDPTRPDPTRPTESPTGESRATSAAVKPDIAALLERGWPKVSRAQRQILNEIAGRHEAGHEFAAATIRATPADRDPLEAVLKADQMWQAATKRRVVAEEQAWQETKAGDREQAAETVDWLESLAR